MRLAFFYPYRTNWYSFLFKITLAQLVLSLCKSSSTLIQKCPKIKPTQKRYKTIKIRFHHRPQDLKVITLSWRLLSPAWTQAPWVRRGCNTLGLKQEDGVDQLGTRIATSGYNIGALIKTFPKGIILLLTLSQLQSKDGELYKYFHGLTSRYLEIICSGFI